MRAVWLKEFGPPEVLVPGDAPDPVAGPGQVVVDVAFANITFVETQFRASGWGPFDADLPTIPGNGVGGVVAGLGAGVDPSWRGRRVVTTTGGSGGYAEQVAVDADGLNPVPDELDLDAAVALLADGRTGLLMMGQAGVKPGERVLVEAAAGGVGSILVQLAAAAGARVVGAAGGIRKAEVVRGLGAEVAVDYAEPGWTDWVRGAVGGIEVVFDSVGGDIGRAAFELLDPGGRMLSFGAASGEMADIDAAAAAARGVTLVPWARPRPEEIRALSARALAEGAAGRLHATIGQRYPLEDAAAAHAAIESRATIGKTLLVVG